MYVRIEVCACRGALFVTVLYRVYRYMHIGIFLYIHRYMYMGRTFGHRCATLFFCVMCAYMCTGIRIYMSECMCEYEGQFITRKLSLGHSQRGGGD